MARMREVGRPRWGLARLQHMSGSRWRALPPWDRGRWVAACCAAGADESGDAGMRWLVDEQDGQPRPRRLVGIDLGIASRHSVRVLEADGRVAGRLSCVPTVES